MPETTSSPRRLDADARLEQLVGVAVAVTAERGYANLSLEEVAARAGVTRAALYRYFPRGKTDLFIAAVERAAEQLTADLVVDDAVPLEDRRARNFSMFIAHALEPSDAWRVNRQARGSGLPEVDELDRRYRQRILDVMAQNHFGTTGPGPYAEVGLRAYLAFAESAFDDARERGLDRERLFEMLTGALLTTVETARELDARAG